MKTLIFVLLSLVTPMNAEVTKVNIPFPTLGGRLFWSDIQVQADWRIQQHVWTGHYRLLAANNIRYCWGSLEDCRAELPVKKEAEVQKPLVLLIHGLGRTKNSMTWLQGKLQENGYRAETYSYASLLEPLEDVSRKLKHVIENLDGPVYVITHSLGGILIRQFTADYPVNKLRGVALMASPNSGAKIVDWVHALKIDFLLGPNGRRLNSDGSLALLPAPSAPFITIGGIQKENGVGHFPLFRLMADHSDGLISEATSRLTGAEKHLAVEVSHTFIIRNELVFKEVDLFFRSVEE